MLPKPVARQGGHSFEGAWLLEKMRGMGNDLQLLWAVQAAQGRAVQGQNLGVVPADDEQGGSEDFGQRIHGQVGAPPARYDRPHGAGTLRGCHQGSSRARTGAEQPDGQAEAQGQIIDGLHNPLRKQGDVKYVGAVQRFFLGEQIEQQGAEPGVLQSLGCAKTTMPRGGVTRHKLPSSRCGPMAMERVSGMQILLMDPADRRPAVA